MAESLWYLWVVCRTPGSNDPLTKSNRYISNTKSNRHISNIAHQISVTGKIKQGRERGSASGSDEVPIFNTVFRKASLGCNISAGPEKSDSESQRVSERTPCVWDSEVAFRKKALPWHAVKGSLKAPGDGTIGTILLLCTTCSDTF